MWQFYKQNIQHVVPFAIENKHYFTVNQTMQSFWREVEDIRDREYNKNKYVSIDNVAPKTLQISGPSFCLYNTKYTLQLNNCHIWKLECISIVLQVAK